MAYTFDAVKTKDAIVAWIRDWFEENGKGCNAVVGISGGKDSSCVAALCAEALGRERVIGVLMPNGEQFDIDMSELLCHHLGIAHYVFNIGETYGAMTAQYAAATGETLSAQSTMNLGPRLRMTTVYLFAQSHNGRVANTCNLSEDWVGYSTKYGDAAGDFSPLSNLTVQEVKAVARACGLPEVLVEKVPNDGLCGKTDEDNLGFTYATLDRYIREGICEDAEIKEKIDVRHVRNLFKLKPMPTFPFDAPVPAKKG